MQNDLMISLPLKGGMKKKYLPKISKFCRYEDLPNKQLQQAMHLILDWDEESVSTRIDCYDAEGGILFSKVEPQHIEEYLEHFEDSAPQQIPLLLDFMQKNEIEFIQY